MLSEFKVLAQAKYSHPPASLPKQKHVAVVNPKSGIPSKPVTQGYQVLPEKTVKEAIEERSEVGERALKDLRHLEKKGAEKKNPSTAKPMPGAPASYSKPLEGKAKVVIKEPTGPNEELKEAKFTYKVREVKTSDGKIVCFKVSKKLWDQAPKEQKALLEKYFSRNLSTTKDGLKFSEQGQDYVIKSPSKSHTSIG